MIGADELPAQGIRVVVEVRPLDSESREAITTSADQVAGAIRSAIEAELSAQGFGGSWVTTGRVERLLR